MEPLELYASRPWLKSYDPGIPHDIDIPDKTVNQILDEACQRYAGKTALVFYGRSISYRVLADDVGRLAAALSQLGVGKGDRVGLYLLNSPQFIIGYFAALRLGAVVTPISPVYTSSEIRHQLEDSGARTVICQDILYDKVARSGVELDHVVVTAVADYLPPLRRFLANTPMARWLPGGAGAQANIPASDRVHRMLELMAEQSGNPPSVADIDPARDLAVLPYTGGTTGNPKGVMLTHRNLIAARTQGKALSYVFREGEETLLAFLPFFHIYGQVVIMLGGLAEGQRLVLFTNVDTESILRAVEDYQVTAFYGVPTLYEYLRTHKDTDKVNWKRLKLVLCGADTLHKSTVEGWHQRTGTQITEGYGLSESCAASHINPLQRPKTGSFGVPLPGILAAVADPESDQFLPVGEVGELLLSGPNIMQGYWNNTEVTARTLVEIQGHRWLRTGDMVRMDEGGYFYYVDRRKDLIKHKGYSIFAKDVEDVLYAHEQIKAAGVVGVPDPTVGEHIKAVVVLESTARGKLSEEEIRDYLHQHLAPYKVPKYIEFRGELPKTDVGKVSRRELREEAGEAR
ncbi:MAG: long-chain fatty acid--CoA ligase [Ectothiorhodospiraceae bacterium]|nr:long-chain fatty acid--CoA ligase [Ectothiorhodospiraceae bacterium]MCH8503991.1 long-chain fatty acid--CoA ligase [Ectothiorhodospiraceae bacterium]